MCNTKCNFCIVAIFLLHELSIEVKPMRIMHKRTESVNKDYRLRNQRRQQNGQFKLFEEFDIFHWPKIKASNHMNLQQFQVSGKHDNYINKTDIKLVDGKQLNNVL
jgi:hypothetical protein